MREAALKYLDQLPRFSPIPGVEREQALLIRARSVVAKRRYYELPAHWTQ